MSNDDMPAPRLLLTTEPTPDMPYVDSDWFRFYGPEEDPGNAALFYEVHELCTGDSCDYRHDARCPWHPAGCGCSFGGCQGAFDTEEYRRTMTSLGLLPGA